MCIDRAFTGLVLSCFSFSGVPDSEIQGGMGLRMTHSQQRVVKPLPFLMYSIISYLEQKIICLP